jgi:hypothetical protein
MTGESGKDIAGASLASGARGRDFAFRIHQAEVADRGQHGGKRQLVSENVGFEPAIGKRNRAMRAKHDVVESATVLAQRHLGVGAAVKIIEYGLGQALARERTEVGDADHMWRQDGSVACGHESSC